MKNEELISPSVEDYLKLIYHIQQEKEKVTSKEISRQMGVKASSVTSMLKKLSEMGILQYTPYQKIILTPEGERVALEVIRHHRLLELFLKEVLGYNLGEVHDEAEKLEHVISEDFEDKLDRVLGSPKIDPHGSPIPDRSGGMIERKLIALSDIEVGKPFVVSQLNCRSKDMLGYLESLGILPNINIRVLEKKPYNGPLYIQIGLHSREIIGHELAKEIFVSPETREDES